MTNQSTQTYSYFNAKAVEWQEKAATDSYHAIRDRQRAALTTLSKLNPESKVLDVGCGTGQLSIEVSHRGHQAIGIDFAEEMIEIARKNNLEAGGSAEFVNASIFDFQPELRFNLISAQGFIEYISESDLIRFLEFLHQFTHKGGAIAIGSRNRLFNLVTFNDFSRMEYDLGQVTTLFDEAILLSNCPTHSALVSKLRTMKSELAMPKQHPGTGIDINTRFQFTPGELTRKIEEYGFSVTAIYPVNYHSFPPAACQNPKLQEIRKSLASTVSENFQGEHRLLPFSSSFVIEAFRK